ncbi:MAG TPA: plastocyanin/azurin family copper-binding protein [Solirubrobacter sp.]|nr:plastocyanin/azurin family copper-binding protein [Solirubrobacter sp.]
MKFVPAGFHTVGIPKKGGGALPAFVPTGEKAVNQADAAGAPFWFNGQDMLSLNPAFMQPAFGKKFTYNGTKSVESGLPLSAKPKPMSVKFTKTGTFTVYCDLHPGMTATVKVLKKGAKVPTAKQDARATTKQAQAALKAAKGLENTKPAANTVDLGVAAKGGVEYFGMVPANLTVPAGTTVKFQMTKGSYEAHTATFGPGNPETEPSSYLGVLAASFEAPALDPRAAYPSDVTAVAVNPALHGNGFWNSGALDAIKASPQPESSSVKFDTPGTYTYYCLIHPFMRGTVTVQ